MVRKINTTLACLIACFDLPAIHLYLLMTAASCPFARHHTGGRKGEAGRFGESGGEGRDNVKLGGTELWNDSAVVW